MKRVVVTGIGAVTPLGNTFVQSWDGTKAGRSGIGWLTRFDASVLPWSAAGELKDFDPLQYLTEKEVRRLDPFVHYAVAASVMAAEDAGLIGRNESSPIHDKGEQGGGVIIGSSRGGISTIERELLKFNGSRVKGHGLRFSPYLMPGTTISMAASYVAQKLGIKGYCLGISNACASGANAIGEAFRLISSGHLPVVIAGGSEAALCRLCMEGYGIAGALAKPPRQAPVPLAPRPFDKARDGFVLSEGACVLVLEELDQAKGRGAYIYGEIIGYGNTSDAFHITRPDPGGEARAMMTAMKEAGVGPEDVDYVNTHGTATAAGDIAEVRAMEIALGKRAGVIPASATKSMTGHMLAASGAFEIASTLMSMKEGVIPPTIHLNERDPACNINIVSGARRADIKVALSSSFGFGGVNVVIALRRT